MVVWETGLGCAPLCYASVGNAQISATQLQQEKQFNKKKLQQGKLCIKSKENRRVCKPEEKIKQKLPRSFTKTQAQRRIGRGAPALRALLHEAWRCNQGGAPTSACHLPRTMHSMDTQHGAAAKSETAKTTKK